MPVRRQAPADKQEYLSTRLAKDVPQGAKLAVCLDPEDDLSGLSEVVDTSGRLFRLVSYAENDLEFRLALRSLMNFSSAKLPVLIRVCMPEFVPLGYRIEMSFIADIIGQSECLPIDLRTDAIITHFTDLAVWPDQLQDYGQRIGRDIQSFVNGYNRLRRAMSQKHPLAEHHILAAILMGTHKELDFSDLDLSYAYPDEIMARVMGLSCRLNLSEEDRQLLIKVFTAASRQVEESVLQAWFALPIEEAAQLLALTDFLTTNQVQNSVILLSSLGLFSQDVKDLKSSVGEVIRLLKERPEDWQPLLQLVDRTISNETASDVVHLLIDAIPAEEWLELIREDTPRSIALALMIGYLKASLGTDQFPLLQLPFVPSWAEKKFDSWKTPHHDSSFEDRAATLLRLIHRVSRIQARLGLPIQLDASLDDHVTSYIESDDHRLELLLALARKDVDAIADDEVIKKVDHFFARLEQMVADRLDSLDRVAAEVIAADHLAYRNHPRSSTRFLKAIASRLRSPKQRLFVWLFDGMRWDTWADVIRPILETGFQIEEQRPLLTPIPTYTGFARTSFFAGSYPDSWRGVKGRFTFNEGELAAKNVGVTSTAMYDQDVVFVTHTDTAAGKSKLRNLQPRRFNFLVFNISDDNIHDEQGDLREVNNQIRQKVKSDVLPEMKRIVEPGDIVIITSDHGFVQLDRNREIPAKVWNETTPEIRRRYATDRDDLDGVVVPFSEKRGVTSTTCMTGKSWFNRKTSRGVGQYTRYDHGGISLSEIIVPGIVLHRAIESEEAHLEVRIPNRLEAVEDGRLRVEVKVVNRGAMAKVRITIADSAKVVDLNKGAEGTHLMEIEATLNLKYIQVKIESQTPDGRYTRIQGGARQIPVNVIPRKDKVEFGKALDVFDDFDGES